jgi:tetratricopeptide (TPR) repeat protein
MFPRGNDTGDANAFQSGVRERDQAIPSFLADPTACRSAFVIKKVSTAKEMGDPGYSQLVRVFDTQDEERRLNTASTIAAKVGRYKEAEESFKKMLELQEKRLGKQHPELAFTYMKLGTVCESDRRWQDAANWYKKGVEVSKADPNDPENLMGAVNLADVARMEGRLGRLDNSAANYKRALQMFEKKDPLSMTPDAMRRIGSIYFEYYHLLAVQGEYEASQNAFARARQLDKAARAKEEAVPKTSRPG